MKTKFQHNLIAVLVIIGLLFFAPAHFLSAQFVQNPSTQETQTTGVNDDSDFFNQAVGVVNIVFAVAIIASIIGFIFAGVKFIIAGGSETTIESAHSTWIASLIGLAVALVGYILVNVVKYFIR